VDGFGEFLGGLFEAFGDGAAEAGAEAAVAAFEGAAPDGRPAQATYDRVLTGGKPPLGVNDR
jgi:hypothetical protein